MRGARAHCHGQRQPARPACDKHANALPGNRARREKGRARKRQVKEQEKKERRRRPTAGPSPLSRHPSFLSSLLSWVPCRSLRRTPHPEFSAMMGVPWLVVTLSRSQTKSRSDMAAGDRQRGNSRPARTSTSFLLLLSFHERKRGGGGGGKKAHVRERHGGGNVRGSAAKKPATRGG